MPTLEFKGKQHIYAHHLTVPHRPLIVDPAKSFPKHQNRGGGGGTPVLSSALPDDNLIIHGDNLHALKALLPRYAGKVNCIYIDPPYNTGKEKWCYNDNVNTPLLSEWYADESPVDSEDLERHDKWLCMMLPRLNLLRDLLADNGVIFVSIDDHEQHRLRALMEDIFGAENFLTNIIWEKKYSPQNDARHFSDNHDFIIAFAKDRSIWRIIPLPRTEEQNARYVNPDNDLRGPWKSSGLDVKTYSSEYDYSITTPSGRVVNPPPGRCWRCTAERFEELVADARIWFGPNGDNVPSVKRFLSEVKQGVTPLTIWKYRDVGHTQSGTQELNRIGLDFPNPKPHTLIRQILQIAMPNDGLVLDSFAGSGPTAHAALALNADDGGSRRFILVELEDYADKTTAERVRRVIKGIPEAKNPQLRDGLGGSFAYCTLGEPLDLETMLKGDSLPPYAELAAYLLYTATGVSVDGAELKPRDDGWFFGDESTDYYLFYEPDLEWLQSNDAVFTEDQAKRIRAAEPGRSAVVFAAGKFIGQRELSRMNITFCQLPYELHRAGG